VRPKSDVLIDVTRLVDRLMQGRQPTGVDRVSLAYVQHYAERARGVIRYAGRWIILSRRDSERLFLWLLAPPDGFAWKVRLLVARYLIMPSGVGCVRSSIIFNTGHAGLDTPDYGHRLDRYGFKLVSFLHDLIPLTHPEYSRAGEWENHERRLRTALTKGKRIIVNSRETSLAVERFAGQKHLPVPPMAVAPLGQADLPFGRPQPPLSGPYFVTVGTIEPRKNHAMLLHVWRSLVEEFGEAAPRLVVVGQLGWECENVLDLLERCEALKPFVTWRSTCDDAELSSWLRHAQALLFPSFVEGYGLPLVEALASGVPVIASNLPIFREVAADIPDYVDPLDGPGWQSLVLEYAGLNSRGRKAQLARMSAFRAPSWKDHFEIVDAFVKGLDVGQS
jgi:glycosyltransferase involved in cell wall biosynthesis